MPRPPSSRPHDAEAGREPPSHASGLAPPALIHALDDLQPDLLNANRGTDRGRAIDPAAVERMCDATRGAHISPGELEHIWRGPPGPPADRSWPDPAGAWYCTDIDWAQKRDSTVAAVVRCETTPLQLVAVYRTQRRSWPMMAAPVGALLDAFPALAAHDQLQGVTLVGRVQTDLFRHDIGAIERHEIVGLRIDACYTEHLYCGEDDLFGSGHPPDTVVALALAYHAFKTGRRPSDATPAGAPAGGTR